MSKFKLDIDLDNAAFEDAPGELARILTDLADYLDAAPGRGVNGKVRDINGNTVGSWWVA